MQAQGRAGPSLIRAGLSSPPAKPLHNIKTPRRRPDQKTRGRRSLVYLLARIPPAMAPALDDLPAEILLLIIQDVTTASYTSARHPLLSLALTSRRLYKHCLPCIYHTVRFYPFVEPLTSMALLLRALMEDPSLGRLVKSVRFCSFPDCSTSVDLKRFRT